MRTLSTRARAVVLTTFVGGWAVLAYACSIGIENPPLPGANTEGGIGPNNVPNLGSASCQKYGGADSVGLLGRQIIDEAKEDCRLSPGFTRADGTAHFAQCFGAFVSAAFGCSSFTENATTDSAQVPCESAMPGLTFSELDWTTFTDFEVKPSAPVKAILEGKGLTEEELLIIKAAFESKRTALANAAIAAGKFSECEGTCQPGGEACRGGTDGGNPPRDAGTDARDSGGPRDAAADG